MSSFRIRPRFQQLVELEPDAVRDRILGSVNAERERFEVKCFPGFICIRIHEQDQHFWSPRLHLSIDPAGPDKSQIRGTYGPNANLWSLFLFGYIILGFLALITGIFGITQSMIGSRPWGLWVLAATIAVLITLYLAAQIGQKLGAQQTFQLHQVYESAIGKSIRIQ